MSLDPREVDSRPASGWRSTPGRVFPARRFEAALNKLQRNEIIRLVEGVGLSQNELASETVGDEITLRHRPTGAWFVCGGSTASYYSRYLAADDPIEERIELSQTRLFQQAEVWASKVKLDAVTPDLWAQLQRESDLLAAVSDESVENTPFTSAEREEIAEQMKELKDYITREHSLSEGQVRLLAERIDYLVEATGRVGRTDWRNVVGGAMLGYVLQAALPPETARAIFTLVVRGVEQIILGGHLGLPGA